MKNFYSWYKKHITTAIFIGLILGILTGLFLACRFEPVLTITSLIGSIYMNALNMMIFPLVFCSIIMPKTVTIRSFPASTLESCINLIFVW